MAPLLPEHALVSLLQQCFIIPRCRVSTARRMLSCSSRKAPHTLHLHLKPRQRQLNAQLRYHYSGSNTGEGGYASLHTRSAGLSPSELEEYHPSKALATTQSQGGQQPNKTPQIAVLGGGITGLTAAHYLSKELPSAQITIYEGSERLGGWLNSKQVELGNGNITVEQGPRTLRPNTPAAFVTLEMIKQLGLQDELLITTKDSDSARNRFVYYPDRLVRMPGPGQKISDMLWSIMTEPVFSGMVAGVLGEFRRPQRPSNVQDESVASFLERRTGSPLVGNNIVSAVLHGIYAGDINQLSARSLMRRLYYQEKVDGSIAKAVINAMKEAAVFMPRKDVDLQSELTANIQGLLSTLNGANASVYTFKKGIGALTDALEKSLQDRYNVTFKLNEKITSVKYDGEGDAIKVETSGVQPPATFDKVISTISGRQLSTLVSGALPSLAETHAVTVMVVNLYFKDPNVLPERGFGYLIPRSVPYDQNPEAALGVVFDSDAIHGQDTAPGTKVTVMLGGHWWDGFDAYPDEEEGAAMAISVLRRHLKIDEEPEYVNVSLQRECIPQYTVGHDSRLMTAHRDLMSGFKGKLMVAGNSYEGVGLNDCVRSARDVVMSIKDGKVATGLENAGKPDWVKIGIDQLRKLQGFRN